MLTENNYVIIVAGGQGLRMGTDIPKQFLLLNKKPVLMHTIEAFYSYDPQMIVILVLPEEQQAYWKQLCSDYSFKVPHKIVNGGRTRFHSVRNGLTLVTTDSMVAIHDGVRPLVNVKLISAVFEAAKTSKAAYPVIAVTDTLRQRMTNKIKTLDRSSFCLAQTPQVFFSRLIQSAYQIEYSDKLTDDISVLEAWRKNTRVQVVDGSPENIKITTPTDLVIAEALLKKCRK